VLGVGDPLQDETLRGWGFIIDNAISRLPKNSKRDDSAVEEAVRSAVRKQFPAGMRPVTRIHIARI